MKGLKKGTKVVFIHSFDYEENCPHCDNAMTSYINKGDTRIVRSVTEHFVEFYEASMDMDEAHKYIKII